MTKDELGKITGRNIRKYREANNLTREQLAEKAGISESFCASLENNGKMMSVPVLMRLADVLNVTANQIVMEESSSGIFDNIIRILEHQPSEFVKSMEEVIKICIKEFSERLANNTDR